MPIAVVCPSCNNKLNAPDNAIGKRVKCPKCLNPFTVSAEGPATKSSPIIPSKAPDSGKKSAPGLRESPEKMPRARKNEDAASELEDDLDEEQEPKPRRKKNAVDDEPLTTASKGSNSLGIASLALGIVAFIVSLIPCVGMVSMPLSALGLILAIIAGAIALVRKGSGIGYPIAGIGVNGLALVVAGLWMSAAAHMKNEAAKDVKANQVTVATESGNNSRTDGSDSTVAAVPNNEPSPAKTAIPVASPKTGTSGPNEKGKASPATEEEWVDASKNSVQQGDFRVRVTKVTVAQVPLKQLGKEGRSKDALLQIELQIENTSTTKIIHYRSWGAAEFGGLPGLNDNFANSYRGASFGISSRPVGQAAREESVYPGKTVNDLLVFDPPLEKAEYLRLRLPAKNFGGTGELRLQIPKSMIQR